MNLLGKNLFQSSHTRAMYKTKSINKLLKKTRSREENNRLSMVHNGKKIEIEKA